MQKTLRRGWIVLDRRQRMVGQIHPTRTKAIDAAEIDANLYWWWLEKKRKWTTARVEVVPSKKRG